MTQKSEVTWVSGMMRQLAARHSACVAVEVKRVGGSTGL